MQKDVIEIRQVKQPVNKLVNGPISIEILELLAARSCGGKYPNHFLSALVQMSRTSRGVQIKTETGF